MSQTKVEANEKPPIILRLFTNKKTRRITLAVLAGVILLLGGIWYWYNSQSIIDRQIVNQANFTVYAPKSVPSGYSLQDDKTKVSRSMLTYSFASQSVEDDVIIVTVQPKPASFDMQQLVGSGTVNTTSTPLGLMYNLSVSGHSQYLVDTGSSLIFLTSSTEIDAVTVNKLVNDLVKLN